MPLPVTFQHFASDLDAAKEHFNAAVKEGETEKKHVLATMALAAAQIALAEATWLASSR